MATPGDAARMGELLIEEGVLTHEELSRAVAESSAKGTPLGALLETLPHVKRADLAAFLAANYRIPVVDDLRRLEIGPSLAEFVPEELARKHELIPIARVGAVLCVAKSNYFNRAAIQDLRNSVEAKVKVFQADEDQVRAALDRIYRGRTSELPAPTSRGKSTTVRRLAAAPAPAPAPAVAEFEAVPLIAPAEDPLRSGRTSAPSASVEEVIEIMDALKIPSQEYASAARDPLARLIAEFEEAFQSGRAVAAQRL
jgi:hypothetical protein